MSTRSGCLTTIVGFNTPMFRWAHTRYSEKRSVYRETKRIDFASALPEQVERNIISQEGKGSVFGETKPVYLGSAVREEVQRR